MQQKYYQISGQNFDRKETFVTAVLSFSLLFTIIQIWISFKSYRKLKIIFMKEKGTAQTNIGIPLQETKSPKK